MAHQTHKLNIPEHVFYTRKFRFDNLVKYAKNISCPNYDGPDTVSHGDGAVIKIKVFRTRLLKVMYDKL